MITTLKYCYRFNHYAARDSNTNAKIISNKYLRYSKVEDQNYIVQYSKPLEFKLDFIIDIKVNL